MENGASGLSRGGERAAGGPAFGLGWLLRQGRFSAEGKYVHAGVDSGPDST